MTIKTMWFIEDDCSVSKLQVEFVERGKYRIPEGHPYAGWIFEEPTGIHSTSAQAFRFAAERCRLKIDLLMQQMVENTQKAHHLGGQEMKEWLREHQHE